MYRLVASSLLFALTNAISAHNTTTEYEYVVIGSGPGGGPLAANLARAGHSVFLLEAGGDNGNNLTDLVPQRYLANSESDNASWSFFVSHFQNETQARRDDKFTYRLNNGSYYVGLDPPEDAEPLGIFYPRGATLGGSAQVNAMNMALPPDSDWQIIADLTGDESWTPANMHTYFEELERNVYLPESTPNHGFDGFVSVRRNNISYVTDRPGLSAVASEAIRQLEGIEVEDEEHLVSLLERDINNAVPARYQNEGVYQLPLHIDENLRRSTGRDFVVDTVNARNEDGTQTYPLTLSTDSLATRVLFREAAEGEKSRAYGVEYLYGEAMYAGDRRYDPKQTGELRKVTASREVIVAGGSFNTPQILKLSGVGPRAELESLEIPVVADLPAVGSYMQDNYEGGISIRAAAPWENNPFAACSPTNPENDTCLDAWYQGWGPYGQGAAPLSIWFRSSVSENDDADLFFFGAAGAEFRGYWPGYSNNPVPPTTFFWSMVKMQVGNQAGTVTLRSSDPRDTSVIDFNYFDTHEERDLQALAEGVDFAFSVFDNVGEPYTPYEVVEPHPGDSVKQALKDRTFGHHVTSTCRMGPKDDPDYCVDSEFKVNGVEGLRVVDASIFPRTPGAFPVGPTFVISQKAFHTLVDGLKE